MLPAGRPDVDPKKSKVDYDKLGRAIEDALILDYIYVLNNTRRQVWSSFIRGIFAGAGGVIGATLGIAILVGMLQLFGGFPVIGHYFRDAGQTIQNHAATP